MRSHSWHSFQNAHVTGFNRANSVLVVNLSGQNFDVYLTRDTEICRDDRPSSLGEIKVGDRVGGYIKKIDGHAVAMELGFANAGKVIPFGYCLNGAIGLIKSPYAKDKPAIKIDPNTPTGTLIKCPYTGKIFQMPLPPLNWTHHWTYD